VDHIGIDLHKRESQICIQTEQGEIIESRIRTDRDRFAAVFGGRPRARILIEAMSESEWVARCLESLGHEVVVADPNFAAMYATRSRRVKTDRRDAMTLADACRLGAYRHAHRTSERQRQVRAELVVRESVVRTRTKFIALTGALLRREGLRIRSGNADHFLRRLDEVTMDDTLRERIRPLERALTLLLAEIRAADQRVAAIVRDDPVIQRLCTVPGVGPITATAFVATIDTIDRFAGAHQLESYLGLVPTERSSGEKQRKGHITKAGNSRLRYLLVEGAWSILLSRKESTEDLRAWAQRIAMRRGMKTAIVALARRLAGILYAMWRDGTTFEPRRREESTAEVVRA
jgi:transposase